MIFFDHVIVVNVQKTTVVVIKIVYGLKGSLPKCKDFLLCCIKS